MTCAAPEVTVAPVNAASPARGKLRRVLASKGFWALADQGVSSAGNFLTTIILGRRLEEKQFGIYLLLLGLMIFCNGVHGALVSYPLSVRGAVADDKGLRRITGSAMAVTLGLQSFFGMALVCMTAALGRLDVLILAVVALGAWQLQETVRRGLLAHLRQRDALWGDTLSYLGQAAAVWGLGISGQLTLTTALLAMAGTSLLAAIVQTIQLKVQFPHWTEVKGQALAFWGLGKWNMLTNFAQLLTVQGFSWTLAIAHGETSVAAFGAIAALLGVSHPVMFSVSNLIVPAVAKAHKTKGLAAAKRTAVTYFLQGVVLLGPYYVALAAVPALALTIFYKAGSPYIVESAALRVFVLAYVMNYLAMTLAALLNGLEKKPGEFQIADDRRGHLRSGRASAGRDRGSMVGVHGRGVERCGTRDRQPHVACTDRAGRCRSAGCRIGRGRHMKIWHVGSGSSPLRVNGVNAAVWLIAREQAKSGHDVSLVVNKEPDDAGRKVAADSGFEVVTISADNWRYDAAQVHSQLARKNPDVVHMHSVFIPRQASFAKLLRAVGVPYIITPHGGVAPQVLQRGKIKKQLYSWFWEQPRFMGAAAITVATPPEADAVRAFVPNFAGLVPLVTNPVEESYFHQAGWMPDPDQKRLVFLGRFDVMCKGIDTLIDVAKLLPEVEVHLYGTDDGDSMADMEKVKRDAPRNAFFHGPVYGADKIKVLEHATMCIQMSRWESFGLSIAEALALGVPCAVTATMNIASLLQECDAACVLAAQPDQAAAKLREVLNDAAALQRLAQNGRQFAERSCEAKSVAGQYAEICQAAIGRRAAVLAG